MVTMMVTMTMMMVMMMVVMMMVGGDGGEKRERNFIVRNGADKKPSTA